MPLSNVGVLESWPDFSNIYNNNELPPCSLDPRRRWWQERQSVCLPLRRVSFPRQRFCHHGGLFWHPGRWWYSLPFSELNHWLAISCQLINKISFKCNNFHQFLQKSPKVGAPGFVNFITAVVYHFYRSLPATFKQPGALTLADLCKLILHYITFTWS